MNLFRKLWKGRVERILLLIFGSLLTLYVLFWSWMNYTGAKHWAEAKAMLRREGETLDFHTTLLPPVPEEKNFCSLPPLKDLASVVDNDAAKGEPGAKRKRLEDAQASSKGTRWAIQGPCLTDRPSACPRGFLAEKSTDLKAWADWLRQEGYRIPCLQVQEMPARAYFGGAFET